MDKEVHNFESVGWGRSEPKIKKTILDALNSNKTIYNFALNNKHILPDESHTFIKLCEGKNAFQPINL